MMNSSEEMTAMKSEGTARFTSWYSKMRMQVWKELPYPKPDWHQWKRIVTAAGPNILDAEVLTLHYIPKEKRVLTQTPWELTIIPKRS